MRFSKHSMWDMNSLARHALKSGFSIVSHFSVKIVRAYFVTLESLLPCGSGFSFSEKPHCTAV